MHPFLFRLFRDNEVKVHELNYLFWECTTRCQLHCRHCGSDCGLHHREKDMPLEDFLKALDTIPRQNRPRPFTVVLTGGEPLLRPDIETVGRAIRSRGFGWGMVTNAWLYDANMHHRLMDAGMGALTISLDGLEENHDWMRGLRGSYARALTAIGLSAGEPCLNADVVTCVNKRNLSELPELHGILSGLGVSAEVVKLQQLCPLPAEAVLRSLEKTGRMVSAEDVCRAGSAGSQALALAAENGLCLRGARRLDLGDGVATHGTVEELRRRCGLDAEAATPGVR